MINVRELIIEECKKIVQMNEDFKKNDSPFSVESVTINGKKFSMEQIEIIAQEES